MRRVSLRYGPKHPVRTPDVVLLVLPPLQRLERGERVGRRVVRGKSAREKRATALEVRSDSLDELRKARIGPQRIEIGILLEQGGIVHAASREAIERPHGVLRPARERLRADEGVGGQKRSRGELHRLVDPRERAVDGPLLQQLERAFDRLVGPGERRLAIGDRSGRPGRLPPRARDDEQRGGEAAENDDRKATDPHHTSPASCRCRWTPGAHDATIRHGSPKFTRNERRPHAFSGSAQGFLVSRVYTHDTRAGGAGFLPYTIAKGARR